MNEQMDSNPYVTGTVSLRNVKCHKCGSQDYKIEGCKGSKGSSTGVAMAFGAVGSLVANSMNKGDFTLKATTFKCNSCRKKFDAMPTPAEEDELLSAPCKIIFNRKSSFAGMAVAQSVWLNGVKMAEVKNGKTVEISTNVKQNTLYVTDHFGVAFKGHYTFEAQPNGVVTVDYKRKFVNK